MAEAFRKSPQLPARRPRGRILRIALAVSALAALAGAAQAQARPGPPWHTRVLADHPLVGFVFDARTGEALPPAAAVRRLAAARFVLLGEKHDNPDHHRLQAWLIEALAARGRRPGVVLEMLDDGQRDALAAQRRARPGDVDGLATALRWERSGWPAWPLYRPIFAAALAADLPLRPGSFERAALRRLAAAAPDAEARAQRTALGLDAPLAPALRDALAAEIESSHCGHAPPERLPAMIETQRLRDARLAQVLAQAPGDGALLIAGTGHTRGDRGVPLHLPHFALQASIASLAFAEVSEERREPPSTARPWPELGPHDLVWLTPRVDALDPCQAFARELERLRQR